MRKLLTAEGLVCPNCTHSHITYAFHIPEPAEVIYIRFVYDPKLLADEERTRMLIQAGMRKYGYAEEGEEADWKKYAPLKNLLTLSVDDPICHRGAAHRHDPQQEHQLGLIEASLGFVAGVNPSGIWRVTVSLHAVVTETVNYRLEVEGEMLQKGRTNDEMDSIRAAHPHVS